MGKILFVTQKRNDAIGRVDQQQKNELLKHQHDCDFFELYEKGTTIIEICYNYIRNIMLLWIKARGYQNIYFSRENPYGVVLKFLSPKKHVTMTVHHVEAYRGESWIGKYIVKTTDMFIAISQFTKQQLRAIGVQESNIVVNYNGISEQFYPEKILNFQDFDYLLYVGTEIPRKNIKTLLCVFAQIKKRYPDIKLVKIGNPGTQEAQQQTDALIQQLGLATDVVLYRTFVTDDELRRRYSNAMCYISLSTLEGFGLTIPEAMACGCPVVASDIGPFREICGEDVNLMDCFDEKAIYDHLVNMLDSESERSRMVNQGLRRAECFTRKRNVTLLLSVFNSITS